jgi:hypothetical protein
MGLFEKLFKKSQKNILPDGFFEMLTGYMPVWRSETEKLYEMELIRAAVHSFATYCSKLKPQVQGSAMKSLENTLQFRPNPFMDTTKFLYRLATILSVENTAFIVPLEDDGGAVVGFYPILPQFCEVVDVRGMPYLRYTFSNGQRAAIEFDRVGVLTSHQYEDDFFGTDNAALRPTMQLIQTQNAGIVNAVKNSAAIRFLAKINNVIKDEDIEKERAKFTQQNLSADNKSGMIIYDNKYAELRQVDSKPFTATARQMEQISENVFRYFGTNAAILENRYNENEWNAYFEGKIEPFALQLSLVMSNMLFSPRELAHGNMVIFTANRLQYANNATKLSLSTQLFDRGLLNRNNIMELWGLPPVEGGDAYYIRKEYAKLEDLGKGENTNADSEGTGVQGDGAAAGDDGGGRLEEV